MGDFEQLTLGEISSLVKNDITMIEVANHYGYATDFKGFCLCPFHGDSRPSMKCYDGSKGFHCYACGENGDVVAFVEKIFNLSFLGALKLLCEDFKLPYFDSRLSKAEQDKIKSEYEERKKAQELAKQKNKQSLDDYHHWLDLFIELDNAKMSEDPNSDKYALAVRNIDYVAWKMEESCAMCTE